MYGCGICAIATCSNNRYSIHVRVGKARENCVLNLYGNTYATYCQKTVCALSNQETTSEYNCMFTLLVKRIQVQNSPAVYTVHAVVMTEVMLYAELYKTTQSGLYLETINFYHKCVHYLEQVPPQT